MCKASIKENLFKFISSFFAFLRRPSHFFSLNPQPYFFKFIFLNYDLSKIDHLINL